MGINPRIILRILIFCSFMFPFCLPAEEETKNELKMDFYKIKRELKALVKDNKKTKPEVIEQELAKLKKVYPKTNKNYYRYLLLRYYYHYYLCEYNKAINDIHELQEWNKGQIPIEHVIQAFAIKFKMTFMNARKIKEGLKIQKEWLKQSENTSLSAYSRSRLYFNIIFFNRELKQWDEAYKYLKEGIDYAFYLKNPIWSYAFYYAIRFDQVLPNISDYDDAIKFLEKFVAFTRKNDRKILTLFNNIEVKKLKSLKTWKNQNENSPCQEVAWEPDIEKTFRKAKQEQKPVLIFTYNPESADHLELINNFYKDPWLVSDTTPFICHKIPIKDLKNPALEIKTPDRRHLLGGFKKYHIQDFLAFIEKGLIKFHSKYTLQKITKEEIPVLRLIADNFLEHGKQKLATLFYKKQLELTKNTHRKIIIKRTLAGLAEIKTAKIKYYTSALEEALKTVDKCVQCPGYIYRNLLEETKGTSAFNHWKQQSDEFHEEYQKRNIYLKYQYIIFNAKETLKKALTKGDFPKGLIIIQETEEKLGKHFLYLYGHQLYAKLASVLSDFGKYDESIKMRKKAIKQALKAGDLRECARHYYNLGNAYSSIGMNDERIKVYRQAAELGLKIKDLHRVGDAYRAIGKHLDDDQEAIDLLQKSCEFLKVSRNYNCLITSQEDLLERYIEMKEFDKARIELAKLKRLTDIWGKEFSYIFCKAKLAIEQGKYAKAISYLKEVSLNNQKLTQDNQKLITSLLADAYYESEDYAKAWDTYLLVLAEIESIRGYLRNQNQRSAYLAKKIGFYMRLYMCALAEGNQAGAFEMMEKSRARAILDLMYEKKLAGNLKIIREKKNLINPTRREEDSSQSDSKQMAAVDNKMRDLEVVIHQESPELGTFMNANVISLKDFQKAINADTTVIEYYMTGVHLYTWIITKTSSKIVKQELDSPAIESTVKGFRSAILKSQANETTQLTEENKKLYNWLIAPIKDKIKTQKLIIIPHKYLFNIPFHALKDENDTYLCEHYIINRLPSASIVKLTKGRKRQSDKMLCFGNPAVATEFDLPFSEQEVREISQSFKSDIFLKDQATETALKGNSNEAGIIHLAAHCFYDKYLPLNSYILLTGDEKNDGRLNSTEAFNLNLKQHPLVVLSACKSGLGPLRNGDEMIGLSGAFFCAGASEIIATLWSISDKKTKNTMKSFYHHLTRMKESSKALNAMQREMIKNNEPIHQWAAFTLYGRNDNNEEKN